jgi:hypothetical protein
MKCTIDSKALPNFTATPICLVSLDCAKIVPNTFTGPSLCQNPASFHWLGGSSSPRLLVSSQFHLRILFEDFGVALSEEVYKRVSRYWGEVSEPGPPVLTVSWLWHIPKRIAHYPDTARSIRATTFARGHPVFHGARQGQV